MSTPGPRARKRCVPSAWDRDLVGAPVRPAPAGEVGGVGRDGHRPVAHQAPAPLPVDADHRGRGPPVEQAGLRGEVVLHVGVEVEVLGREVGEGADGEAGAVDAAERQRVAGDLHGHVRHAALGHEGEQGLQVRGLGGGERARQVTPGDPRLHGADEPGGGARGGERGLEQVDGRGLPAGPGHAEHAEAGGRVPVDQGRGGAEGAARVVVDQNGHAGVAHRGPLGSRRVGEDGDGAAREGGGGVVGPVGAGPGQGGEEVPGADVLGAQGGSGDRARPARGVDRTDRAGGGVVGPGRGDPVRDGVHRDRGDPLGPGRDRGVGGALRSVHRHLRARLAELAAGPATGVVNGPGRRGGHVREGYSPAGRTRRRGAHDPPYLRRRRWGRGAGLTGAAAGPCAGAPSTPAAGPARRGRTRCRGRAGPPSRHRAARRASARPRTAGPRPGTCPRR